MAFLDMSEVDTHLRKMTESIDYRAITVDILKTVYALTIENFIQESYFGKKWASLAPSTIERRTKLGYVPINILRQTGALYSSIFWKATSDRAGEIGVGSNIFYAAKLQYGIGKMPARPFMPENMEPSLQSAISELFVGKAALKYFKFKS